VATPAPGVPVIYAGYDSLDAFIGYGIPGEGPGFQDTIVLIYGFDPAGNRVIGLEILSSRETPGLGDKIYKDEKWVGAFRDLSLEPEIKVVKGGADAANEIDAITGATISSKAVVRIINTAHRSWEGNLPVTPAPGEASS
jgi:electron transport complex protein RnfG